MRAILLTASVLALALTGCKQSEQAAAQTVPAAPVAPAGDPVVQGPPNKKDATPAFAGQTRAPESRSDVTLKVQTVATGIDEPWGMALLPDGALLVTARTGKLWRVTPAGEKTEVGGVPGVDSRGQGGLLDISLAPNFTNKRQLYFTFSEDRGSKTNGTTLARATLSADNSKLENVEVVFQQQPAWASTLHFGSNIEWDSAGNIFLTLGERSLPASRVHAQDITTHLGKVVHLTPDGKPASNNPYLGRSDALPEVWSYGHRNVQGAAIHPDTGKLWTVEHGPRGGDELNIPQAGKNYGWPVIVYGIDYPGGPIGDGITARTGMEQPVYYWDPVIAPGDMMFYSGNLFPWKGDLLIASLAGAIVRLELLDERVVGEEVLLSGQGRIRDVQEAADGSLWVITDESNGKVLNVRPG